MLPRPSKLKKISNYKLLNNDGQERYTIFKGANLRNAWRYSKTSIVAILAVFGFVQMIILILTKISAIKKYSYIEDDDCKLVDTLVPNYGSHVHYNVTFADQFFDEVRVLCWILTGPANHKKKAQHIKNTWGKRCNKLIFMSSVEDTELGAVALPVPEGRKNLWGKTKEAFKYIYKHHFDEYDWFFKGDDDTYVVVENLRKMLYEYNTEYPIHLGAKLSKRGRQVFNSGGAGYVLSKEALRRFIEKALPNATICRPELDGEEDLEIGRCLQNVEVLNGDSRDEFGRSRMFGYLPDTFVGTSIPKYHKWYWKSMIYKMDLGPNCCSDHAISFHYVIPTEMYVLDYLIYHLRPFGITPIPYVLPKKKSLDEIISALYNFTKKNIIHRFRTSHKS